MQCTVPDDASHHYLLFHLNEWSQSSSGRLMISLIKPLFHTFVLDTVCAHTPRDTAPWRGLKMKHDTPYSEQLLGWLRSLLKD